MYFLHGLMVRGKKKQTQNYYSNFLSNMRQNVENLKVVFQQQGAE